MRCSEIMAQLERLAPPQCACVWDNPGLLAGRAEKEVNKVLIALDATDQVVELAEKEQCDLVLTHHPLIFQPLKKVNDQDFIGRRIVKLIRADISYYAMHTNFDIAPGGMAGLAAKLLGFEPRGPLEETGEWPATGEPCGIGAWGVLEQPVTLKELARRVKERFALCAVRVYEADKPEALIERVAVCPGSGKGMAEAALSRGAQVLITGDIGHHDGIDAAARGLSIIDGGHYGLEHIFVDFMEAYLREEVSRELTIRKAPVSDPAKVW